MKRRLRNEEREKKNKTKRLESEIRLKRKWD